MYAVDHIRRVLHDVPRRLQRHRRVQHPQGVRLVEGLGRDRQPDQSGARPRPRLRRRGRPRRHPAQRHRHAVRQDGRRAGLPVADEGAAQAAPARDDHLGPHRPRPRRPSGAGVAREAAERSPRHVEMVEAMLADPALAHVSFDISWDEVAKYAVVVARDDRARVAALLNKYSGPLPLRDRHGGAVGSRAVLRGVRHVGAGVPSTHARGQPQGAQGQLHADLRRRPSARPRMGEEHMAARISDSGGRRSGAPAHRVRDRAGHGGTRADHGTRPSPRPHRGRTAAEPAGQRAGHVREADASTSTASPCSTWGTTSPRSIPTGSTRCG